MWKVDFLFIFALYPYLGSFFQHFLYVFINFLIRYLFYYVFRFQYDLVHRIFHCVLGTEKRNLIKIRYTHLLPIFYRFFQSLGKKRQKIGSKCVDLILIRLREKHIQYTGVQTLVFRTEVLTSVGFQKWVCSGANVILLFQS